MAAPNPPLFFHKLRPGNGKHRTLGSVLTLHRQFHLSPLDALARNREGSVNGPLALWHKVNAVGPFHPSGSWRGQHLGAGPCFRDAGPGSKAKPSAPQVTIVLPHIPRPTPVGDSPLLPRAEPGTELHRPARAQREFGNLSGLD